MRSMGLLDLLDPKGVALVELRHVADPSEEVLRSPQVRPEMHPVGIVRLSGFMFCVKRRGCQEACSALRTSRAIATTH